MNEKISMTVTFLSPLTPRDFKRQSLVFSYMNVEVSSLDGAEHDVQVYTDASAEWVSGDVAVTAQWDFGLRNGVAYHKVSSQTQQTFAEVMDRAEWGNFYYATDSRDGLTHQSGPDIDVRSMFVCNGALDDSDDTNHRAINDNWPVFGYAIDLGLQRAEYLIQNSLYPAEQLSTDDFAGHLANQTNLALKGIIGIEAMSHISQLIGEDADAQNYTTIAHDYISKWQSPAVNVVDSPPHAILNYGNATTWGLLYNLYNDKPFNTNLVPQEVYDIQSSFYPTVKKRYGVPLDTRNRYYTKSDWELFCAAIASEETRDMFISDLVKWVNETPTSRLLIDLYQTSDGGHPTGLEFKARPVVGGLFALLLLEQEGYASPPSRRNDA
ncbi:hypothetical protein N0V94_007920 [Neodidymelliopsis sp. IMI 364377]|nr:hypothetical protein N0V94_007920 [Neodidymelliopsis sp. IMI 364377]